MFFFSSTKESSLHQAVLNHDLEAIRILSADKNLRDLKNGLGFTALELARYLGQKDSQRILDPSAKWFINVAPKGSDVPFRINEYQFKDQFGVEFRPYLNFGSYPFFKEVLTNCPWILKKSFLGEENREQAWKYRHELHNGYKANMSIKWINEEMGYGAFTNFALETGEYVGEFTGAVRRLYRRSPDQNEYCFHYPTRWFSRKYVIIDAMNEGNETRFINHSDTPNLQPLCLCAGNLLHIVFIAKHPIEPDAELTYDYGKAFWKKRQKF
ncbi:MAG: SET domain-containing protein-lysine N-methyltransferase [Parachlamydiaceae bacterium]|nr:SET domain-containing protein-lysine N-methyltransferase [Parachlamydiaceae bacterium]